jgi:hypothetical protein
MSTWNRGHIVGRKAPLKSLRAKPDYMPSLRFAAASYAFLGRADDARRTVERIRRVDPKLRVSNLAEVVPLRRAEHMALLAEGCEGPDCRNESLAVLPAPQLRQAGSQHPKSAGSAAGRMAKQPSNC